MNYMNIMVLINELNKLIKDKSSMFKFHTYASHLDEYSYPQICKIYDAINNKIYEKIKWKGILNFNVKIVYALFCIITEEVYNVEINCKNTILNDLDLWLKYFDCYVL